MLRIPCPWCGLRDQAEFRCGGEDGHSRPETPEQLTDAQWVDYLHYRENHKGVQRERWFHAWGCRQWFVLERNTLTHGIEQGPGS